jgi:hypothetical protein
MIVKEDFDAQTYIKPINILAGAHLPVKFVDHSWTSNVGSYS